ncbi:hypothetical protein [Roseitranquillus sediminis]|uniref:hypothetical protein n=1 Tax=Roseitranquillus sediminis TaxID=2809051 RepID=UPI001D0C453E|nr:hypothetical protein [Roseitranquillus sediminis]MBM9594980.1 hypothetical protein [Roseitranquillus sediminis]
MAGAAFRMFFGDRPATVEELERVEEITVEQEMEMAWEARVRMVLCLDDKGHWKNQARDFAQPFSRFRIEVQLGKGAFVPLIDGPVAGVTAEMSASPGESVVNLVVRDDSVLMNREEATEVFEERLDSDLATEMFGRFSTITSTDVLPTSGAQPITVKRGTPIQFVRELAKVNGYLAYVLPGEAPSQSVGCFRPPDTSRSSLPPLVLLGDKRNLTGATFDDDSEGQERTRGWSLRISDQQVVSAERSAQDQDLLGGLPQVSDDQSALRELPPEENTREDPESETDAQARHASYSLKMTGQVVPGCYDAVLAPYRTIAIKAGDTPYSGDWLIRKVTHRINTSVYTQEIEARRNAVSDPGGGLPFLGGVF